MFVLIIILMTSDYRGGVSASSIRFSDKLLCEDAMYGLQKKMVNEIYSKVVLQCSEVSK